MTGPSGALLLAGVQLLAGTFIWMWLTMVIYPVVDRGHYRSSTWAIVPLMFGLALALEGSTRLLGLATALAAALFLAAVYIQRPLLEWSSGASASLIGGGLLVAGATSSCGGDCATPALHAVLGALMVGSVTHAMVLGHWYLNQPRLPIEPLRGATRIMLVVTVASLAAGGADRGALVAGQIPASILAFSGAGYWWTWLILMVGILVLGMMVRATVRTRSTQSATGLLYVAMIPALVAQFVLNLLALP